MMERWDDGEMIWSRDEMMEWWDDDNLERWDDGEMRWWYDGEKVLWDFRVNGKQKVFLKAKGLQGGEKERRKEGKEWWSEQGSEQGSEQESDGWMVEWLCGCSVWMVVWIDGCEDGWLWGWTVVWMDLWLDGWNVGWLDGWMYRHRPLPFQYSWLRGVEDLRWVLALRHKVNRFPFQQDIFQTVVAKKSSASFSHTEIQEPVHESSLPKGIIISCRRLLPGTKLPVEPVPFLTPLSNLHWSYRNRADRRRPFS